MGRFKSENQRALRLSSLHVAVIRGATQEVLDILKSEAGRKTINSRDLYGSTALMMAVLTGRLNIARLLLRNGASTTARDYKGRNALKYGRASLFKRKLAIYRRFGLRAVSKNQEIRRSRITKILRHPAARASRFVFFGGISTYLYSSSLTSALAVASETMSFQDPFSTKQAID